MAQESYPTSQLWRSERPTALLLAFLVSVCCWPPVAVAAEESQNPAVSLPCTECHGELTLAYRHPPVVEDCLNCHVEHFEPAPAPSNLQDDLNDLCLGCHDDPDDTGGHPVVSHPTEGRPDPFDPTRPFSCVSCHNPHQSNMPALFKYRYDVRRAASEGYPCALCHHRSANPAPTSPVPEKELLRENVAN